MLKSLRLENFRGFEDHSVDLSDRTLLVGANNAGKSTIVEAIRLVSLVANRPGLNATAPPDWLGDAARSPYGFRPSLKGMEFELDGAAFHQFGSPPARLTATFRSRGKIEVLVGADAQVFAVLRGRGGEPVRTPTQREHAALTRIGVQPQVGPVQRREPVRDEDYVKEALDSSLAPSHFRNQVLRLSEYWDGFSQDAEGTWPQLRLFPPEVDEDDKGRFVRLLVRDGGFTGDLASMGHGLQMWLQMLWFLARNRDTPTIVLDEPDVYMHADLQRKLIRFVGGGEVERQLLIATHSVEMMAEAEPSEIVVVAASRKRSRSAKDVAAMQRVISDLGGVHSLQYARLWSTKRCLLLEGKDMEILKPLHDRLFPKADALDTSPYFSIGGWGGWHYAIGIAGFITHGDADVRVYTVFDSDYHWLTEIAKRREEASKKDVELEVWPVKEIENFLLVPTVIQRVIAQRCDDPPTIRTIEERLSELAETLKNEVVEGFTDTQPTSSWTASKKRKAAEQHTDARWGTLTERLTVIPGKTALGQMAQWSKQEFNVSFGRGTLVSAMTATDIPIHLRTFLENVERCRPLTRPS